MITLYRSQHCDLKTLTKLMKEMIKIGKPQLLVGDFNFCYLDASSNPTYQYLHQSFFKQLIYEPTHLEGNLLDQTHLRDMKGNLHYTARLHSRYYTDHKALELFLDKGK